MGYLSFIPGRSFLFKKRGMAKKQERKSLNDATGETLGASLRRKPEANKFVLTKEDPVPRHAPEALRIVREWIRYKDEHNLEKAKELTASNCFFTFLDSDTEMPAREFFQAVQDTYASFPDLHFFWKSMEVQGSNSSTSSSPGTVVVVKDYYGIGKHTGAPYFFGPYPPMEPAGTTVRDENIEFTFTVRDGKIVDATIYAHGKLVGPPGFYTKIGGVIIG